MEKFAAFKALFPEVDEGGYRNCVGRHTHINIQSFMKAFLSPAHYIQSQLGPSYEEKKVENAIIFFQQ